MTDIKQQHNWSGFPGAWCLNCGCENPAENPEVPYDPECQGELDAYNPYVNRVPIDTPKE